MAVMNNNKSGFIALAVLLGIGIIAYYWITSAEAPGGYHVKTGNYRLEDGQWDNAIKEFNEALKENPKSPYAYYGLGTTFIQTGKLDKALESFNTALDMKPDFAAVYVNRGILYDKKGQYRLALADYKKALKLDPEVGEGPGWIWRFLRGVDKKPPTIVDRAVYIENELKKPPEKRLLRVPEEDDKQEMYKID